MLGEISTKLEGIRAALYSETYQWSQTAERIITQVISTHNAILVVMGLVARKMTEIRSKGEKKLQKPEFHSPVMEIRTRWQ